MKSVRIETTDNGNTLLIDVQCDCGHNALIDEETGNADTKHTISFFGNREKKLRCNCGKKYTIFPQGSHVHIFSE